MKLKITDLGEGNLLVQKGWVGVKLTNNMTVADIEATLKAAFGMYDRETAKYNQEGFIV